MTQRTSTIIYVIFKHGEMPTLQIFRKFLLIFSDGPHPHATQTMEVVEDKSGRLIYRSVVRAATEKKDLDAFIEDWAHGINFHNVSTVVSTYDGQGLLWGTFAKDLRTGHFHIRRYFEHLFELDDVRVEFESGETRQYNDVFIRSGSYRFSYLKRGHLVYVPARYSFVCKKERTGWYILEHHQLDAYAGQYEHEPAPGEKPYSSYVKVQGDQLVLDGMALRAESDGRFFADDIESTYIFAKDGQGSVTKMIREFGRYKFTAKKIK